MTIQYRELHLDSAYLDDYRGAIRSKTYAWDGFARTQLINSTESKNLQILETLYFNREKSLKDAAIDGSYDAFIQTLLALLLKDLPVERNDIRKYVLVAISDFLGVEAFVEQLLSKNELSSYFSALVRLSDNGDEIIRLLAIYNASILLVQGSAHFADIETLKIVDELIKLLGTSNFNLQMLAIGLIAEILSSSNKGYRLLFWSKQDELLPLMFKNLNSTLSHLDTKNTVEVIQFQYLNLLALWILTFQTDKLSILSSYYLEDLLVLVKILKLSIKDKISRLCISVILNLTTPETKSSLDTLKYLILNADFVTILNNLKERKLNDEELVAALDDLIANTTEIFNKLTSFDEYAQELHMRKFKNSPVHFKEEFFLDNISKFQDQNYKIFKEVLSILDEENLDSTTLKILLDDLYKLLRIDNNTLQILVKSGYKVKVMQLLTHKNADVRYEALKVTQLLVSQSLK